MVDLHQQLDQTKNNERAGELKRPVRTLGFGRAEQREYNRLFGLFGPGELGCSTVREGCLDTVIQTSNEERLPKSYVPIRFCLGTNIWTAGCIAR
jgi:hypothetical protein